MIHNEDIICISSIDWDFIWQANQEVMYELACNDNRILFIENTGVRALKISDLPRIKKRIKVWLNSIKGFRKETDNLYIYSAVLLPFPYSRLARFINRHLILSSLNRWIKCLGFRDPIIWSFLPTPLCLDIINNINHKAFVYYNIDNLSVTSKAARKIVKFEKEVVKRSDVVFAMSKTMTDYFSHFNKNVFRIPAGVNLARFADINYKDGAKPKELSKIKTKIIGYVGGIRKSIDVELVDYLARQLPEFSFVFVGPLQINTSKLKKHKNIVFIGQKAHEDLPCYIKCFDVCIIPYRKDDYSDNISPAKLNEYLIMGKPVVSTNLKEIENFDKENGKILYKANNYQEFANMILEAIEQDSETLRKRRIEIARSNSWAKKIAQMSEIVEDAIRKREAAADVNWQEKLIAIYKAVRKRLARLVFTISFVFLLIFHTPFIWFLAQPLKITDTSQKADVIVVFAGGVGESGKAGQGYEERVDYAVDLYKQGYADYIIFSSGYAYRFKEAEVMKALAVSIGVPEEAILIEERATTTYENVKFTKEILDDNNWESILLVSSPYHMRRVALTYRKNAEEIEIKYTPVPYSAFYNHTRGAKLRHIRGILHEYLGIIYYWWKGYI